MIATFVIFLREGIEAAMIVAVLMAYLRQIGHREYFRYLFLGVLAAFVLMIIGGVTAFITIRDYSGSRTQMIFETSTYLVAAFILTYMTFWMRSHSRSISTELKKRAQFALGEQIDSDEKLSQKAKWSLGLLAFQSVGREGLETMVFTLAIFFASKGPAPIRSGIIGGIGGLLVALIIANFVYRLGQKLNFKLFFQVMGALLMVFAAGLLVDSVQNLQQLHWLPILTHPLWNTNSFLPQSSTLGGIIHSFFGYSSQPTLLQVLTYVIYLSITLGIFLGVGRNRLIIRKNEKTQLEI